MSSPAPLETPTLPPARVLAWTGSLASIVDFPPDDKGVVTMARLLAREFPLETFTDAALHAVAADLERWSFKRLTGLLRTWRETNTSHRAAQDSTLAGLTGEEAALVRLHRDRRRKGESVALLETTLDRNFPRALAALERSGEAVKAIAAPPPPAEVTKPTLGLVGLVTRHFRVRPEDGVPRFHAPARTVEQQLAALGHPGGPSRPETRARPLRG